MKGEHPGYRARNLDVANAYGLSSGLCKIQDRLRGKNRTPNWLMMELSELIHLYGYGRTNCLIRPLIEHRDELPPTYEVK